MYWGQEPRITDPKPPIFSTSPWLLPTDAIDTVADCLLLLLDSSTIRSVLLCHHSTLPGPVKAIRKPDHRTESYQGPRLRTTVASTRVCGLTRLDSIQRIFCVRVRIQEKEATPRESILRREFKIAVQQINNQLPPELHIHYIAFDFHRAAKSKGADVIDIMASIAEESLKLTGFFHAGPRVYSNLLHRVRTKLVGATGAIETSVGGWVGADARRH